MIRKSLQALFIQLTKKNRFRFNFYTQKNATTKFIDDQLPHQTDEEGKIVPSNKNDFICDWDDKFDLMEVRNHKLLLDHLRSVKYAYEFNDLVYFVRHLAQIAIEHGTQRQIIFDPNFKSLIEHIKKCLQEGKHDKYPFIGSYAYCLCILNVKDNELWHLLEQKILNDEWYTNFKESVYAVQGFEKLLPVLYGNPNLQSRIDEVYKKLERVVRLTIWEVNPKWYQTISLALAKVNRFDPETFAKLETHILNNLSLEYHTSQMVDILFAFAKGKQGSSKFYNAIQYVLFKGHMFNTNIFLQNQVQLKYDGEMVCKLLEIYVDASEKFQNFQVHPDLKNIIHKLITNKKTIYTLEQATKTLSLMKKLDYEEMDIKEMKLLVYNKIMLLDAFIPIDDIIGFYQYIENTAQDPQDLPFQLFEKLEHQIIKQSGEMMNEELYQILSYLYERPGFIVNNERLSEQVVRVLEMRLSSLEGGQIDQLIQLFQKSIQQNLLQLEHQMKQENEQKLLNDQSNIKVVGFLKNQLVFKRFQKDPVEMVQKSQNIRLIIPTYKKLLKKLEDIKLIQQYQVKSKE